MYEKSIEYLNRAVGDELSAVHQYMYFHFHCDDQGLDLLAGLFRRTAIEEMMHIERYAERILFLKGDVILKASAEVEPVNDVAQMLQRARDLELAAIKDYNGWAFTCAQQADSVTKKLFEDIVADEERHYAQFDDEAEKLVRFGDSYLALQSIERSKSVAQAAPLRGGE